MHKKELPPVIPSREMIVGALDAPLRLTMFGDYESAETRQLTEVVIELLEEFSGKINLTFRHFPLTSKHQKAHKAAEAAIAAGQEGKFWEMHQQLMQHPHELGITSLKGHARQVGVINKHFLDQLMNGTYGWYVQDDLKYGLELGIKEIPALLINGNRVEAPLNLNQIKKIILKELKQVNAPAKKIRA
jgi:protein-disulfide isomerase